jgi:TP901 family phage tail tape measure protein
MSDIKAGLDDEVSYDEYTKQLAEMGIDVIDAQGNLRDMGGVIEEIGEKWTAMSRNQQVALAQIIAGTRQYSRMMSLFDNWDMYESAKETSLNSAGAVQQ